MILGPFGICHAGTSTSDWRSAPASQPAASRPEPFPGAS